MEHRILIIKSINKEIKNKNISIQRKLDLYRMRAFLNLEIEKFNSVISDSNKCLDYLEILNKEKNIPYEIKKIYNNSSADKMRKLEIGRNLKGFKYFGDTINHLKVRRAKIGSYKDELSDEDILYCNIEMKNLNTYFK